MMTRPAAGTLLPTVTLLVLAVILCFLGGLMVWLFWPYQIMTIQKLSVETPSVLSGTFLAYKMDYCKNFEYVTTPGTVQYAFLAVGQISYASIGQRYALLPTGCTSITEAIRVPILPPGHYRLEMLRTYRVNPVRDILIHAVSEPFEVTSRFGASPAEIH